MYISMDIFLFLQLNNNKHIIASEASELSILELSSWNVSKNIYFKLFPIIICS